MAGLFSIFVKKCWNTCFGRRDGASSMWPSSLHVGQIPHKKICCKFDFYTICIVWKCKVGFSNDTFWMFEDGIQIFGQ